MILAELENWQGSRTAILEQENDAIHLYSHPSDDQREMKPLWVANSKKRILKRSTIEADMNKGRQPYLPGKFCNSNGYIVDYSDENAWELQWGLDQNSIAVLFKNRIVAIMPEWSGMNGFYGYSIGTDHETPVAWPLLEDNIQIERFEKEKEFLQNWSEATWVTHQENLVNLYGQHFQGESRYFAADGGKWPPLGLQCSSINGCNFLGTVGLSQLPMPSLGMNYDDDVVEAYRRIELAILAENIPDIEPLARYLSGQATHPWHWGTHFDQGHTIPCAQLADVGSEMSFMAFVEEASFLPRVDTPKFLEFDTRLLFMVPIYDTEQQFAEQDSTGELVRRLERADRPLDVKRERVV